MSFSNVEILTLLFCAEGGGEAAGAAGGFVVQAEVVEYLQQSLLSQSRLAHCGIIVSLDI